MTEISEKIVHIIEPYEKLRGSENDWLPTLRTSPDARVDGRVRLAIVVSEEVAESIDVVNPEGKTLMRINLFNHGERTGPSADVIFTPTCFTNYLVQAWRTGERILLQTAEAVGVSISQVKNQ